MITKKQTGNAHSAQAVSGANVNCSVEGLDMLTEGHHMRVVELQANLMQLEKQATDNNHLSTDQEVYRNSADRVRADIAIENDLYKENISRLEKKCE